MTTHDHVVARPSSKLTPGQALLAVVLIWLGFMGLRAGDFTQVWAPVPAWVPLRRVVASLCGVISIGCGAGLLSQRSALTASRILFGALGVWLLVFRLANLFFERPLVLAAWTFGSTGVMVAAAWALSIRYRRDPEWAPVGPLADERGLRVARVLFGVSLIPFGLAHFFYPDATTVLIPGWLPWHLAFAWLTGATFIAAGLAVATGAMAGPAAVLVTIQMGLFGLIVWVPRVVAGTVSDFQWGEFVITCALTAGAWVVAETYRRPRDTP